jgi:hypothetical protein
VSPPPDADEETLQREYVFDDPYYRRWVQLNIVSDFGLSVPGATGDV